MFYDVKCFGMIIVVICYVLVDLKVYFIEFLEFISVIQSFFYEELVLIIWKQKWFNKDVDNLCLLVILFNIVYFFFKITFQIVLSIYYKISLVFFFLYYVMEI